MIVELTYVHTRVPCRDGDEPLSSNVGVVFYVLVFCDLLETLVDLIEYSNKLNPTFSREFS